MFEPIKTERLLLRPVVSGDAGPLAERRSDPKVALYQSWTTPYELPKAERLVEAVASMSGPEDDEWWMLTIVDGTGDIVGDLAIHPTWGGKSVEIGYTLAPSAWGFGYATEAVAALVEYFFTATEAVRLHAMLHPDNEASARVLERTGFIYEGRTVASYWVGDDNTDDLLYGMTKADWLDWQHRPSAPPASLELIEITAANKRSVSKLATHKSQERFVSPVTACFREALLPDHVDGEPVTAVLRAIEADGELAGVVLVTLVDDHHHEPLLWRLLIDRRHQRRGIGSKVIDLVIDEAKQQGAASLLITWGGGIGSPDPLYLAKGFVPTGNTVDGETEGRLLLGDARLSDSPDEQDGVR